MFEALREELSRNAGNCPQCKRKMKLAFLDVGDGEWVVAHYACQNPECRYGKNRVKIYRRMIRKIEDELLRRITAEERKKYRRIREAALLAEIRCPICGKKERYLYSGVDENGRLIHSFRCDNDFCPNRKEIKIELTEKDVLKIEAKKPPLECPVCGKIPTATVHCPKEQKIICEKHCFGCEHQNEWDMHCDFVHPEERRAEAKAAVDGRKWFNECIKQ